MRATRVLRSKLFFCLGLSVLSIGWSQRVKAEGVRNYALFFGTVPVTLLLVSVISTAFFTDFEVKSEEQKPSDELYKKMTKDSSRNNKIYATQKP